MSTPCVTSCEAQRKDVVRCCLNFGFEGGDLSPLQNNRGIGGVPPKKLTISSAEILSIRRKCTYTCKSRDSRKSSKKQNRWMADFAFWLGCDCKTLVLKYNIFTKCGASNFLLRFQLLLSGLSTPCFARLATSRRALCFKASSLFARQLGIAALPNCPANGL